MKSLFRFILYTIFILLFLIAAWLLYVNHLKNQFSDGTTIDDVTYNLDSYKSQELQTILDIMSAQYDSAGVQASIILRDGTIWSGASGYVNHGKKISTTTKSLFNIGSVTKMFTATLVMSILEEKLLTLDDSLSELAVVGNPKWDNLTVEQLLNHTSGIPDYMESNMLSIFSFPNKRWLRKDLIESVFVEPMRDPNIFNYSNTNYLLLANIVENIAKDSFRNTFIARLVMPLQLKNTYYEAPNLEQLPIAHSYETQIPGFQKLNVTGFRHSFLTSGNAAGAIVSNASDVAKFTQALFNNQILSEDSLKSMTNFSLVEEHRMPQNTGYGLGVSRWELDGVELWGHSGFIPGFSSITMYSPKHQYVITVLTNQSNLSAGKVLKQLQEKLLESGQFNIN